jgi:small conductance mechanosensitive channel
MNVVAAILIFIIGKWLAGFISRISEKLMTRAKVDQTLIPFAKNMIYFAILVIVVIMAIGKLGVQTTSFVAVIGAAGLAVGLALQGSLANFAAGVMLILFKPFGVGDTIEASGAIGTVQEIQIFNTILISPENKRIIVPNAKITADKIIVHKRS